MQLFTVVVLLATLAVSSAVTRTAQCDVAVNADKPPGDDMVTGTVTFEQEDEGVVTVSINVSGFDTNDNNTEHGFHVHTSGDIETSCTDAGGHYNPENNNHSAPASALRHVGDLGNIMQDFDGNVVNSFDDSMISLTGDYNIIGRAIVIHQLKDDLGEGGDQGSIETGNAGARISCCQIYDTTSGSVGAAAANVFTLVFALALSYLVAAI